MYKYAHMCEVQIALYTEGLSEAGALASGPSCDDAAGALIATSGRVDGTTGLGSGTRRLRGWLLCELLV
jgi:hypothetical protein